MNDDFDTKDNSVKDKKLKTCIGFVYGGTLMKSGYVYIFSFTDTHVNDYVKNTFVKYFGRYLCCRCVKCANAETTLADLLDLAEEYNYTIETNCNIFKCDVNEATELLKKVRNIDAKK